MHKVLKNKKLLLLFIPIIFITLFTVYGSTPVNITTTGNSINSNEKQYVQTDKGTKKLSLQYSTNASDTVNLKIYNPMGELVDSASISDSNLYEKEFINVEGEWTIDIIPSNGKDILVESTITKM